MIISFVNIYVVQISKHKFFFSSRSQKLAYINQIKIKFHYLIYRIFLEISNLSIFFIESDKSFMNKKKKMNDNNLF